MTEAEYTNLEPNYEDAKMVIPTWDPISVSAVQRHYTWGLQPRGPLARDASRARASALGPDDR